MSLSTFFARGNTLPLISATAVSGLTASSATGSSVGQATINTAQSGGAWSIMSGGPFAISSGGAITSTSALSQETYPVVYAYSFPYDGETIVIEQTLSVVVGAAAVAAPTITSVPTISGTPKAGSILTATHAAFAGAVNGVAGQWYYADTGAAISGATGLTYTPSAADAAASHTFDYQEVATNSGGNSPAAISATTAACAALVLSTITEAGAATPTAGGAAGTLICNLSGVTTGSSISLSPNDGRVVLGLNGSTPALFIGTTAASAGAIAYTITETDSYASNSGKTSSLSITFQSASATPYDLNFAAQTYTTPTGTVSDPVASGLLTFSRASTKYVRNVAGGYSQVASGALPVSNLGLSLEDAATNLLFPSDTTGASSSSLPAGWSISAVAGITPSYAADTDPVTGLPRLQITMSGTATAAGNITLGLAASTAPVTAGSAYCYSLFWQLLSGSLFYNTAFRQQLSWYTSGGGAISPTIYNGKDRLMGRSDRIKAGDTAAPRRTWYTAVAPATAAKAAPALTMFIASGQVVNFTVALICPQFEQVASSTTGPSSPILTSTAAVTRAADSCAAAGGLLTMLQGSQGFAEVTTSRMRPTQLGVAAAPQPILTINSVNALKRGVDGSIRSELGSAPATYRGYRTNSETLQTKHCLSWDGTNVRVASSAVAEYANGTGALPSVTSAALANGCHHARFRVGPTAPANLNSYASVALDYAVYGAPSGGVTGACRAAASGLNTAVIGGWRDHNDNVGGMLRGGLMEVDASNPLSFGGFSLDYLQWINERSGITTINAKFIDTNDAQAWIDYMLRTYKVPIYFTKGAASVSTTAATRSGTATNLLASFTTTDTTGGVSWTSASVPAKTFTATYFQDASYEGDLIAAAGVTTIVGRETSDSSDPVNGFLGGATGAGYSASSGISNHEFLPTAGSSYTTIDTIDPYVTAGTSSSGLIYGVNADPGIAFGAADARVQAYCFRETITSTVADLAAYPTAAPRNYAASKYELLLRGIAARVSAGATPVSFSTAITTSAFSLQLFGIFNQIGSLYDLNNQGPASIDHIGQNWAYPNASYAAREAIWGDHQDWQSGWWYTLQHTADARMPAQIQSDALNIGRSVSHYLEPHENDTANWCPQLYIREARRMVGDFVFKQTDVSTTTGSPRSANIVAALSYSVDSHHAQRLVDLHTSGVARVVAEGNILGGGSSQNPIPMEVLFPKRVDAANIMATFAVSSHHTGFGALRMELAHMALGEAAGCIAAQQIAAGAQPAVQDVVYSTLQSTLLLLGAVTPPYMGPPPTLATLTVSSNTPTAGTADSFSVTGTNALSTLTATSSDGTALSVSGSVITGTFASAGSPTVTLVETLPGNTGSKTTVITFTVEPASGSSGTMDFSQAGNPLAGN